MNVIKIPAKPQKGNNAAKIEVQKLRVAAYCRVSTDNEEQASSYETQIAHYREFISANPEWELVNVYADEGISATSTKGREQFNAMIEDCKKGKIDMIFTKSISRFARNTVDCLNYIRMLKEINIPVFFEKESINTMDDAAQKEHTKRIKELQKFIRSQSSEITEFEEALVRKLLEKVTVHSEYLEIRFKSGVTICVEK